MCECATFVDNDVLFGVLDTLGLSLHPSHSLPSTVPSLQICECINDLWMEQQGGWQRRRHVGSVLIEPGPVLLAPPWPRQSCTPTHALLLLCDAPVGLFLFQLQRVRGSVFVCVYVVCVCVCVNVLLHLYHHINT